MNPRQKQRIAELEAELERWKVQHEEMLLKYAREQNGALSALEKALNEIARLKEVIEDLSDHGVAAERMALLKAQQVEIERLQAEHGKICDSRREWMEACIAARQEIERLKKKAED